jgi:hypothetical protein
MNQKEFAPMKEIIATAIAKQYLAVLMIVGNTDFVS